MGKAGSPTHQIDRFTPQVICHPAGTQTFLYVFV
jgi:hypothetical protein